MMYVYIIGRRSEETPLFALYGFLSPTIMLIEKNAIVATIEVLNIFLSHCHWKKKSVLRTYLYHINVPCSNACTLRHQGHTIFKSTEDRSGYYTHQLEINWFPLCQTSNSPSFFIHMQYTAYTRAHRTWNSVHSTVTMQTVKPTHGNLFDWQFYSANISFLSTVRLPDDRICSVFFIW